MNRPIAVEDLADRLPAKARLIGIDLGTKTIGLALSDVERRLASPLKTLPRTAFQKDADALLAIFAEFAIAAIVLGLPLDLEGRDSRRTQSTRAFARNLAARTDLPIAFWDERFSTDEAHRIFDMHEYKQKKRKPYIDMMAAQLILQGFLDAQKKG